MSSATAAPTANDTLSVAAQGQAPGLVQGSLRTSISPSLSFPGGLLAVIIVFVIASIALVVTSAYFTTERLSMARKLIAAAGSETQGLAAALPSASTALGVLGQAGKPFKLL